MTDVLHLIKLSVGTESVADLAAWQADRRWQTADGFPRHVTRMWPKRAEELLSGGSIYWVIRGVVLCRQRFMRFDEVVRADGIRRCGMVLDPELIRVAAVPRKPFQGWRYLQGSDAPPDLRSSAGAEEELPHDLSVALAKIGIL